jgi:biotin operon repressor
MEALQYLNQCKNSTPKSTGNASHWIIGKLLIENDEVATTLLNEMGYRHNTINHAMRKLRELGFKIARFRRGRLGFYTLQSVECNGKVINKKLSKKERLWRIALTI